MNNILLAEDEEILRMLITDIFEDEDYVIDEAEDGQEALHLSESNKYDLIILDYMMPCYTGAEVAEAIKKDGQNKDAAILMLSAKSQQSEKEGALKSGVDYFMEKPFSPVELLKKVREILGND
ncbi:response regulator transcription factor [Mesobacillus zeae]|uniref:Response regulator n=1 Tax=Mesobacillus zeae TaxID=1917180 RepID=A0A398BAM6_9BACI|nr:response regulator transcription factor [Mesobacillus zeae]RID84683.1 response regulator [Mesobacillus zeae]